MSADGRDTPARQRAWLIYRLRGLWHQCGIMPTPYWRDLARAQVDAELQALGVETETARRARLEAEAAEEARREAELDLPF